MRTKHAKYTTKLPTTKVAALKGRIRMLGWRYGNSEFMCGHSSF